MLKEHRGFILWYHHGITIRRTGDEGLKDTTDMEKDRQYMKMALELAQKGMGFTAPNPMVGAVIVKSGKIIGQGYHRKYGELHAEREALAVVYGRTQKVHPYMLLWNPAAIMGNSLRVSMQSWKSGIRRVIIGSSDPNPLVAGKGIRILKEHGIEVTENVLKEECDKLNEAFLLLHPKSKTVCGHEICDDHGWKNCHLYRCIQMGDRRSCQNACAETATEIYGNYGWSGNCAGR